jgi:hypothetical protein
MAMTTTVIALVTFVLNKECNKQAHNHGIDINLIYLLDSFEMEKSISRIDSIIGHNR